MKKHERRGYADTSYRHYCRCHANISDGIRICNKWYPEVAANAIQLKFDDSFLINIFPAVYFIATKLEAFKDRGENDGRFSTDSDDIVYVLNNRTSIWEEFFVAPTSIYTYLKDEFKKLIDEPYIDEWISAHLDYGGNKEESVSSSETYPNSSTKINYNQDSI